MGKCLISITLLSCGLVLSSAGWTKEPTLTEQLASMEKAARSSLDQQLFTVDGLDVTAWRDEQPVIIQVPILNEKREWQGDSHYYFKQGKLFAVRMPYGLYRFDSKGALILWLDETGVQSELPGTAAWSARQNWLQKRARQLADAFAPSRYEQRLKKPNSDIHLQGAAKVEYLCSGQLYALTGAEKLLHEAGALQVEGPTEGRWSLAGDARPRFADEWRPLHFRCEVDGADRVSHLTYSYTTEHASAETTDAK